MAMGVDDLGQIGLIGRRAMGLPLGSFQQQVEAALHHFRPAVPCQIQEPGKQPRPGHVVRIDKGDVAGIRMQPPIVSRRGAAAVFLAQQNDLFVAGIGFGHQIARPVG